MGKYDDMLELPHHQSEKHPQMSMYNRAAQFAPFAALNGFDDAIDETGQINYDRIVEENKPELDPDILRIEISEDDPLGNII